MDHDDDEIKEPLVLDDDEEETEPVEEDGLEEPKGDPFEKDEDKWV